jgi:hypothetical protein
MALTFHGAQGGLFMLRSESGASTQELTWARGAVVLNLDDPSHISWSRFPEPIAPASPLR